MASLGPHGVETSRGYDPHRFQLYIGGSWVEAASGDHRSIRNPATQEPVGEVAWGSRADVVAALESAQQAFADWSRRPAHERGDILITAARLLRDRQASIAHLITREMGKPIGQARAEVDNAARIIAFFGEESKRISGEVVASPASHKRHFVIKQPIGVVGVITPWNNPVNSLSYKLAPALGSGCTVVAKPAEEAPLSAIELVRCFADAGIPPGVLHVVTGEPEEVGGEIVASPITRKIAFTGSTEVGKRIMRAAAEHVKKLTLELGGHAPVIVFDDVEPAWAAARAVAIKFINSGQTCVAANRLLVHERIADDFIREFVQRTKTLKVGIGDDPDVDLGPLVSEQQLQKVIGHVEDAVAKGAHALCGGTRPADRALDQGWFYLPTALDQVTPQMRVAVEETFGPVAPVMRFVTEEEAIAIANMTRYGLAAYVLTKDLERGWRMAERLEFGTVGINDARPFIPEAPFGGHKQSGLGVKGSHFGLDEFLELKHVSVEFREPGG